MSALDRLNRRYSKYGINLDAAFPASRGLSQIDLLGGTPSPEEQESILGDAGRSLMGGLQYLGETLDKPGRALRGVLAGRPEELLNLVPLSDTFGWTDPATQVTGRDLLEKSGVLGSNTPGLDWGDVAGFGAEVLLDPLTLVAGPVKGLSVAGKAAVKAGTILPRHTPEVIKAVDEGLTGILNIGIPGVPFVSEFKPLKSFGTGPKAASALEAVHYGKYSPLRVARSLLGSETYGISDGAVQKVAEEKAVTTAKQRAASAEQVADLIPKTDAMRQQLVKELMARNSKLTEADAVVRAKTLERQGLELADNLPSVDGIKGIVRIGGRHSDEDADGIAAILRGASSGASDVRATTTAEEFHRQFPHLGRGDYSEALGVQWQNSPANLSKIPSGVEFQHHPDIDAALMQADPSLTPDVLAAMKPAKKWKLLFPEDIEETYKPVLLDASPTWSEVVPNEKFRQPLPSEVADVAGKPAVLAEPLPAKFTDPFIVRTQAGIYKLYQHGGDIKPQTFDSAIEAQNAAVPGLIPDPILRGAQLEHVGSRMEEAVSKVALSMKSVSGRGQAMLDAFSGQTADDTLKNLGKRIYNWLPEADVEAIAKSGQYTLADGTIDLDGVAKGFSQFVLNTPLNATTDLDHAFGAMGHTLARMWESAGQSPAVRKRLSPKTLDYFDKTFKPHEYLGYMDQQRAAWLATERAHSGTLDQMRQLDADRLTEMQDWGLNVPGLNDTMIRHLARRWSSDLPKSEARRKFNELFGWMQLARNDALRNIPGGTGALRRMSIDKNIAGKPGDLDQAAEYLTKNYGVGQENAKQLASFLQGLDAKQVQDGIPIFNRDALTDIADYLHTSDKMLAAAKALHPMLESLSQLPTADTPIAEVWKGLGLTPKGLEKFVATTGIAADAKVPAESVDQLMRFMSSHTRSAEIHPLTKTWDKVHRAFKTHLTAIWPAKHSRDLMDSLFRSWTAGAASPEGMGGIMDALRGKFDADDAAAQAAQQAGKDYVPLRTMLNEMIAHRTFEKYGSTTSELLEFAGQMLRTDKSVAKQAFEPMFEAWKDMKKSPLAFARGLNPFADATAEVGGKTKSVAMAAGQGVGDLMDILTRGQHYITLRRKGFSPLAAHESVAQHLFRWNELNDFEKTHARRWVTFYAWMRKNLPYRLEQLLGAPGGRTAQTVRAYGNLQDEADANGWTPNFIRQRGGIPLGADENGVNEYLTGNPLGIADFNNFVLPSTGDMARPAIRRSTENMLSQLNPLIGLGIETYTGNQLWSGRPLKYLHGFTPEWMPMNRAADQLLSHSPVSRAMTTARRLTDDRKSAAAKAINFASGFSLSQVSPEDVAKYQMVDLLDMAQAIAKDNPHLKDYQRVFVEPEDIEHLSEDTKRLLAAHIEKARVYQAQKREQAKQKLVIRQKG